MDITAQHANDRQQILTLIYIYIQIVSQVEKNNKIHDSPLSMVTAIYNASDDGIPEIVLVEKSVRICI